MRERARKANLAKNAKCATYRARMTCCALPDPSFAIAHDSSRHAPPLWTPLHRSAAHDAAQTHPHCPPLPAWTPRGPRQLAPVSFCCPPHVHHPNRAARAGPAPRHEAIPARLLGSQTRAAAAGAVEAVTDDPRGSVVVAAAGRDRFSSLASCSHLNAAHAQRNPFDADAFDVTGRQRRRRRLPSRMSPSCWQRDDRDVADGRRLPPLIDAVSRPDRWPTMAAAAAACDSRKMAAMSETVTGKAGAGAGRRATWATVRADVWPVFRPAPPGPRPSRCRIRRVPF